MTLLVNKAPVGGTVEIKCTGKGCPFKLRSRPIVSTCKPSRKHLCHAPTSKTINVVSLLQGARLRPGETLVVDLVRANWIGKDYRFRIRGGLGPRVSISCLAPGGTSPGAGC
jgi:hypothetical protein